MMAPPATPRSRATANVRIGYADFRRFFNLMCMAAEVQLHATKAGLAAIRATESVEVATMAQGRLDAKLATARHVFLGGSCDPTTWRKDTCIPVFEAAGVSYFNPQTTDWQPSFIELEARAKEDCHVLLFVIDDCTRAIASMLESTEYIMRRQNVVIVIREIAADQLIDNEPLGQRQLKDLNRARQFLADIAERHPALCQVRLAIVNHPRFNLAFNAISYTNSCYYINFTALGVCHRRGRVPLYNSHASRM